MAASSARVPGGGLAPAAAGPGGAGWDEEGGSVSSTACDMTLPGGWGGAGCGQGVVTMLR